ncbi:MAG: gamma-glutamylcyclotransferase [Puniceicoccaceae bacterium]|nr:MAG: gamma-glutamylcyclotransferase [Puniceicoccaceae bacterium]
MSPVKVFVYGTLKPGGHYWPQYCEGKVARQQPAKIRGELYDLHVGYPGLRLQGQAWVYGYCLELKDPAHLDSLDYLEGYAPNRPESENEYNRIRVPCFDLEDQPIGQVWAYEITPSAFAKNQTTHIQNGNWPVACNSIEFNLSTESPAHGKPLPARWDAG